MLFSTSGGILLQASRPGGTVKGWRGFGYLEWCHLPSCSGGASSPGDRSAGGDPACSALCLCALPAKATSLSSPPPHQPTAWPLQEQKRSRAAEMRVCEVNTAPAAADEPGGRSDAAGKELNQKLRRSLRNALQWTESSPKPETAARRTMTASEGSGHE